MKLNVKLQAFFTSALDGVSALSWENLAIIHYKDGWFSECVWTLWRRNFALEQVIDTDGE